MNNFLILLSFTVILSISIVPVLFENTLAQEIMPPRKQWKQQHDLDQLTCNEGMLLLQKNDDTPACVLPSTYFKLIDRQYGKYDSNLFEKQPEMIDNLLSNMVSNQDIMQHWHDMMIQNPKIMQETMSMWIAEMKDDPNFLKKFMDPMINEPNLREKMITKMKEHPVMMNTLKENTKWMHSVHEEMTESNMDSHMGQNYTGSMHSSSHSMQHTMSFHNQEVMMDMIHHIWVSDSMRDKMAQFMLESPNHMPMMADQLMDHTLYSMMDDSALRQQMIEVMLENNEFMNSFRHENR